MYRIPLTSQNVLVPCTLVASVETGKFVCVNEDGSSLTIEPWGAERLGGTPAGDANFDSPYTRAELLGEFLVYRSATAQSKGTPVGYRMVGA